MEESEGFNYEYAIDEAVQLLPVFPVNDSPDVDFDAIDCEMINNIDFVDDVELPNNPIIEIIGMKSYATFYVSGDANNSKLVVRIKNLGCFFMIKLVLRDSKGYERLFEISNKRSNILIDDKSCQLPLEVEQGWQHIPICLNNLLQKAYGTSLSGIKEITVHGSCRLAKIYLAPREYADAQLPKWLRVAIKDETVF